MASLIQNITQAITDFGAIKQSLINKNLSIPTGTPTSSYSTLIDSLETYNKLDYQRWLEYGGKDYHNYSSLEEVFTSGDYIDLLNTEKSAAYSAYISSEIANAIKNNSTYIREALLGTYNYMYINSSFDFDENIENLVDENPKVTKNTYQGIVTWSADRCTDPSLYDYPKVYDVGYYGYMAFDNQADSSNLSVVYQDRHIWSAMGTNQWVQYKYPTAKNLYGVSIYSLRDNAPVSVKIEGSNDGENFTLIKEQKLSGSIGAEVVDRVICCERTPYQYYRFTISDNVYSGTCGVGEIRIFTFK